MMIWCRQCASWCCFGLRMNSGDATPSVTVWGHSVSPPTHTHQQIMMMLPDTYACACHYVSAHACMYCLHYWYRCMQEFVYMHVGASVELCALLCDWNICCEPLWHDLELLSFSVNVLATDQNVYMLGYVKTSATLSGVCKRMLYLPHTGQWCFNHTHLDVMANRSWRCSAMNVSCCDSPWFASFSLHSKKQWFRMLPEWLTRVWLSVSQWGSREMRRMFPVILSENLSALHALEAPEENVLSG